MNSITKNRQNQEQLEQMVSEIFGTAVKLTTYKELADGFCNIAYWLKLSDDRECIMKISPDVNVKMMSCEVDLMRTEVGAMRMVKDSHAVGVAEVYGYDSSRRICSGEYFIMEKLTGQNYFSMKEEMSEQQRETIEFQTGKALKRLHEIRGQKFGHFCERSLQFDTWYEAFSSMLTRTITDGERANIQIGTDYEEIKQKLVEHKCYFEEVTDACLIHFDSWDGNIFVEDSRIVGLIDWERALWGEGLMEDRFRFHNRCQSFLDGYGIRELTEAQHIRCMWYDVNLYLIMMFEGTYRHYDNNDQYNWVHGLFNQIWPALKEK